MTLNIKQKPHIVLNVRNRGHFKRQLLNIVKASTISKSIDNKQSNPDNVSKSDHRRVVAVAVFFVYCVFKNKRVVCICSADSEFESFPRQSINENFEKVISLRSCLISITRTSYSKVRVSNQHPNIVEEFEECSSVAQPRKSVLLQTT